MSAASDVTKFRQIIAEYSVGAAAREAWSTDQPISTSGTITAMSGFILPSSYMGTATLASGTVTVTSAGCKSTSYVFLTHKTFTSQGILRVTPGNGSFVITSASGSDASTVQWMIVNPA